MAVKIRLTRYGAKKKPFYRIVAIDSREKRDGKYIELLGTYNPLSEPSTINLDEEKTLKWLNNGAIPTETARNLLSKIGIIKKFHESKLPKKEKVVKKVEPKKEESKKESVKKATTIKKTTTKTTAKKESK